MARNIDTGLLRTFMTVASTTSMTATANAVHRTQGAVSQQIRRLEELFDCRLFHRHRRGLRLTNAGERLHEKARRLLDLNDEIWADMTSPDFTGEVRLGIPFDLVGTRLPPVLKAFARACPRVDISLVCAASPDLVDVLKTGLVDLAVVEEEIGLSHTECLSIERLVWVGARDGAAYQKRPLPLSIISDNCAFRPAVLATLRDHGLQWKTVFENGNIDATRATVRMDLAITASLASTVPPDLNVLTRDSGLPDLPSFAINLHLPRSGVDAAAQELVQHLRAGFLGRPHRAA